MDIPNCIGFVMDGNRRWAKDRSLPAVDGHKEGSKIFEKTIRNAAELGVKNLIFYAFSTENWKRSPKEISYLFDLMEKGFRDMKEVHKNKLRVRFIGNRDKLSSKLTSLMDGIEKDTADYKGGLVAVALSYGGRAEIVNATNEIIASGVKGPVTEKEFASHLWTKDIPDPDLIIRTGEAMRLSNFLPWQSVYSELYFTSTLWPDFDREEFEYILDEYKDRERRMGK